MDTTDSAHVQRLNAQGNVLRTSVTSGSGGGVGPEYRSCLPAPAPVQTTRLPE
jgi:hypothetical protein